MPVLFLGHGSPMNAIEDNAYVRAWRALGESLPRPRAILCVSAHWYVDGTWVTGNERPETIHDFGGFPRALHEVRYPARGDGALAARIAKLFDERRGQVGHDWGLDHGAWSVLVHLRPEADVPVLQLSLDRRAPPERHLELGRALAPLRDEGVLVVASGNITHNLRHAMMAMTTGRHDEAAWAVRFDRRVAEAVDDRAHAQLTSALATDDGKLAHPTPDHYLPLLYAAGASSADDPVSHPVSGMDLGSLSMRAILWG
jgi:4,5-DOPA dioxygenase extradiol